MDRRGTGCSERLAPGQAATLEEMIDDPSRRRFASSGSRSELACTREKSTIDGKVGGIAVNIGARVAREDGQSEVLVSRTVKDLVAGSGLAFEDAGEHDLKGIPDRRRLYRAGS
jgi:class 3 adenylate cyclase